MRKSSNEAEAEAEFHRRCADYIEIADSLSEIGIKLPKNLHKNITKLELLDLIINANDNHPELLEIFQKVVNEIKEYKIQVFFLLERIRTTQFYKENSFGGKF